MSKSSFKKSYCTGVNNINASHPSSKGVYCSTPKKKKHTRPSEISHGSFVKSLQDVFHEIRCQANRSSARSQPEVCGEEAGRLNNVCGLSKRENEAPNSQNSLSKGAEL